MKENVMDRSIGRELRLFVDFVRYLRASVQERLSYFKESVRDLWMPFPVKSVLIIRDRGYGDIVRTIPLLPKIRAKYPDAHISFVTDKNFEIAVKCSPHIDKVYVHEDMEDLAAKNFDVVINFQIFDNSAFVRELLPKLQYKRFYGSNLDENGKFEVQEVCTHRTWMERFCHIAHVKYSLKDSENYQIVFPQGWENENKHVLAKIGERGEKPLVALALGSNDHIGSSGWYRNYSVDFLIKMAEELSKDFDLLIVGQKKDRREEDFEKIDKLCAMPGVRSVLDQLSLWELHLAIHDCDCLITPDTGPLHIAIGVDTPVVALFGQSTASIVVSPKMQTEKFTLMQSDKPCAPCEDRLLEECRACHRAKCMDSFNVEDIHNAVSRHCSSKIGK